MSTEDRAAEADREQSAGPGAAWLDELPSEALRDLYQRLPAEVDRACERARQGMRDGYLRGVLAVHKALAPSGLFKDWRGAARINYRTAQSIVARAEQAVRRKQEQEHERERAPGPDAEPEDGRGREQAAETASQSRSVASEGEPAPEAGTGAEARGKSRRAQLVLPLEDDTQKADIKAGLRDVATAEGLPPDQWGAAILRLLELYRKHRAAEAAVAPAAEAA